ncbi:MAG: plasmid pRiA4b ORF-3 family protein [Alphaproteobacteria bacterium]|nr:plasmid pRiA4b ORF-3 family protein [Alphaproteobacteria bacterium]
MTAVSIARLKITLDDVEPKVVRRVEVPFSIRLDRLHQTLQAALGWTDTHLFEIRARDVGWGMPDPDWGDGPLDARKATLASIVEDTGAKTLRYLYDFGDGWEHTIKIERLFDPLPGVSYPRLIEATGRCPPEDVGGPWGYAEFLEALADPEHEQHADMRRWIGEDFDPRQAQSDQLAERVEKLARKWTRKPASRKARAT